MGNNRILVKLNPILEWPINSSRVIRDSTDLLNMKEKERNYYTFIASQSV
jgi:hypothetical protein